MRNNSNSFGYVMPQQFVRTPVADQLECLNKVRHVSEPDYNAFTENFYLEQVDFDGDSR